MTSALFLEDQVIPALGLPANLVLTPMAALRNASGQAYLTYFSPRQIELSGDAFGQYDGATIDAFGGLTLMFDSQGRLQSAFLRPVTDEDVRQIRTMTAELITYGLIARSTLGSDVRLHEPQHAQSDVPRALSLPGFDWSHPEEKQPKLVRFPVLFDPIPRSPTNFLERLQSWLRASPGR
jgi:hypothetical protein